MGSPVGTLPGGQGVAVAVDGTGVAVDVAVDGTAVDVLVAVDGTAVDVLVAVDGTGVLVGVLVGGTGVFVGVLVGVDVDVAPASWTLRSWFIAPEPSRLSVRMWNGAPVIAPAPLPAPQ